MNRNTKILVTGANGLLGTEIINLLKKKKINHIGIYSKSLDMTNLKDLESFFIANKPNFVIHAANKVYGIGGNQNKKFEMINENLIINANLLKLCEKYKIKKILCIGSSAVYSDKFKKNISEKNIFKFEPHKSEFYYGISKRILLHQLIALSKQSGIKFTFVIMNNLYGMKDNFNINTGHVVPSLIHKFYLAKKNITKVELWGDPKTKRSFLYAKDAAKIILELLKKNIKIINISGKNEITIQNLSKIIGKIYNFKAKIKWRKNKLKGVRRRNLNCKLQNKLQIKEEYSLEEGLKETISWFLRKYDTNSLRK